MTRTTEIIYSNLFSALGHESFGSAASEQPLSPWKQRRVAELREALEADGEYDEGMTYRFLSTMQERWREELVHSERHNYDTSTETLALLNIIVYNASCMERRDVSVPGVIAFGRYLRERGNRVDYVKLDRWLRRLALRGVASLLASLLIEAFGFEKDEFPFRHRIYRHAYRDLCLRLERGGYSGVVSRTAALLRFTPLSALGFWQQRTRFALDSIEE